MKIALNIMAIAVVLAWATGYFFLEYGKQMHFYLLLACFILWMRNFKNRQSSH